jgi:hypothetical protein
MKQRSRWERPFSATIFHEPLQRFKRYRPAKRVGFFVSRKPSPLASRTIRGRLFRICRFFAGHFGEQFDYRPVMHGLVQ